MELELAWELVKETAKEREWEKMWVTWWGWQMAPALVGWRGSEGGRTFRNKVPYART